MQQQCHSPTKACSDASDLPLSGLRVLDLSRVLAGPFCTQILADYGASVLKVEQPGIGDETRLWRTSGEARVWKDEHSDMSLYYAAVNRNKRSVTLNLKDPEAIKIVKRLAKESDVFVHNFVPGKIEQMGLSYDVLKKENERLIYASVSGYGTSGPNRDRAGYDGIALAEAGLLHITGERNGPPTKPGVAIGDMSTGLYTHGAILAALLKRDRTGVGCKIESSLFETGLSLLINVGVSALNLDNRRGERWGLGHPSLVPYGGFKTKDDKVVFLAANNQRQWQLLCKTIGLESLLEEPKYATNEKRLKSRDELEGIIQRTVASRTKEEWMKLLDGTGLPYGAINDIVEAVEHPQTTAREMIMEIEEFEAARDGMLKLIAPAVKIEGTKLDVIRRKPPILGEHTEEVLEGLGYTVADIARMRELGTV